jgi:hypothetical protein
MGRTVEGGYVLNRPFRRRKSSQQRRSDTHRRGGKLSSSFYPRAPRPLGAIHRSELVQGWRRTRDVVGKHNLAAEGHASLSHHWTAHRDQGFLATCQSLALWHGERVTEGSWTTRQDCSNRERARLLLAPSCDAQRGKWARQQRAGAQRRGLPPPNPVEVLAATSFARNSPGQLAHSGRRLRDWTTSQIEEAQGADSGDEQPASRLVAVKFRL